MSAALVALITLPLVALPGDLPPDPRHLANGWPIPSEGYLDQPYVVVLPDGTWLCAVTTGPGAEGAKGQHVVARRSADRGRTWSEAVDIEPSDGPEASYVVLLQTPYGRIYALYNHNTDGVTEVKREDKGVYTRVDSLGHYVFRYSDDGGRTWSPQRYDVPVREFACDRNNVYGGALRFFWNVGRPIVLRDGSALLTLHKVGAMGVDFFAQSEGCFLRSPNLTEERDPAKLVFETLPVGDLGLSAPAGGGRVSEEQSVVELYDGSLYCVWRTVAGWPASAYSRDRGQTWTEPAWAAYEPGGRRFKQPRAANFVWQCGNGRYLYWFHNHGGPALRAAVAAGRASIWDDRNPGWLSAGREVDTPEGRVIVWSEPEIALYHDDPYIRLSYPDLIEDGGEYYLTETKKDEGATHLLPKALIDGLFGQHEARTVSRDGLLLEAEAPVSPLALPRLPQWLARDNATSDHRTKDLRGGLSLELALKPLDEAGEVLLVDNRDEAGSGFSLRALPGGALRWTMNDGRQECAWTSQHELLRPGQPNHLVLTVDGGPKIIWLVANGRLADGGDELQFGWGRYSPTLRTPPNHPARLHDAVSLLRLYGRPLTVSQAVGNQRAWTT